MFDQNHARLPKALDPAIRLRTAITTAVNAASSRVAVDAASSRVKFLGCQMRAFRAHHPVALIQSPSSSNARSTSTSGAFFGWGTAALTGERQDAASTGCRSVFQRRCRTALVFPELGPPFSPCAGRQAAWRLWRTTSPIACTTRCNSTSASSGKIGRLSTSRAARSVSGRLPGP